MDYIQKKVKKLIGEYETNDPYLLAKDMGIDIDEFPFRCIKGIILEIEGKVIIVLNSNLPEWFKRMVLAHELGHKELSPSGSGYFFLTEYTMIEDKVEYEANRFMVELLSWNEKQEQDETIEQFAKRIGVHPEMMRYKVIK